MTDPDARRSEIAAGLQDVRHRIAAACQAAGRRPDDVRLIAVTKFFPVTDVVHLAELGIADFGESRDQEAAGKVARFAELSDRPATWHFIGRLQTNKARSVARYADLVHSVDRSELAEALAAGAARADRVLPVLVQFSFDADPARGGAAATELRRLADQVAELPGLRLAGVMAIAPLDSDPDAAFARLAEAAAAVRADHPGAEVLSAGMSGDLEAAIAHGATHVRVGTALLGRRATHFR